MMNQRTFNNSLQLLNGRLSKVEQLLVEVSLDIRTLKKRVLSENNIHLDISEKTSEQVNDETEALEETTEETTQQTTEEATEETTEETNEEATEEVVEATEPGKR